MGPGLASIRTARFGAHATRTAIGLTGMVFTFGAVLLLPLAEATTLQFTVPIFATILGAMVLGEKTGWHRWGAVAVGFAGVLVVAQPGSGEFPLFGAIVGLLAALFVAIVAITLRQIGKTESSGTTVFWFSVLSLPPLGVAYLFQLQSHDWLTWANLVAIGLVGGVAQLALTASVRFAPVSTVIPMDYSSLIWGTFYGWLIFGAWPTPWTWLGAPIIIASGLYIVWRERVLHVQQTEGASDAPAS
jgi:drug/metabolite transporter (DMT)-like permease